MLYGHYCMRAVVGRRVDEPQSVRLHGRSLRFIAADECVEW
jgi:hypothetical protein